MVRPEDLAILVWAGVLAVGGPLQAETPAEPNQGGMARTLEMPAHRALMDRRAQPETKLAPFKSDGCSGGLSNVWGLVSGQFPQFAAAHEEAPPWEFCCVVHDMAYHDAGGAQTAGASYANRAQADDALRACVIQTGEQRRYQLARQYDVDPETVSSAYEVVAEAMHLAVRFGGAPCSGLPWRWGFGFPDCSLLSLSTKD